MLLVLVRALALPRFNKGTTFKPQTGTIRKLLCFQVPLVEDFFNFTVLVLVLLPMWANRPETFFTAFNFLHYNFTAINLCSHLEFIFCRSKFLASRYS